MKQLMEFMGPKMKEEELTKIWGMSDKASAHVVDNIHRVMIAAATRFNPYQFDHLLTLIRKVGTSKGCLDVRGLTTQKAKGMVATNAVRAYKQYQYSFIILVTFIDFHFSHSGFYTLV